jgi:hypothetical protein
LPRSRGETTSAIAAWEIAISPPPPIPCSARARISCGSVCATAQNRAAITNTTIAGISVRRRPNWSDSLP